MESVEVGMEITQGADKTYSFTLNRTYTLTKDKLIAGPFYFCSPIIQEQKMMLSKQSIREPCMGKLQQQKLIIAALVGLVARESWAETYPSELDYFQEFPTVLSASRLSQPVSEAPNAMTVIDRKMIVASGFRTIPDLFKLVPGMYVSYYKGHQAIVSYHGSTDQYARRMQVLIDGRSVYLPPVSTVGWENLPITVDDIERIEVIRGPAAASHGANSTQGVISIVTRDANGVHGKHVSITRGNKGINDVSARFGHLGETYDYRMTLAYTADNGYDNLSVPPNGLPISSTQLLNNSNDSNQARLMNFRAGYHPTSSDSFDIQFGFNHDIQGVGFNDKNPSPIKPTSTNGNTPHDLFSNSAFWQLGWIRTFDNASELNVRYYHIRQDQHETFPIYYGGVLINPVTQSTKISRDEIEVQHTLPLSTSNRLVYGGAYRTDRIDGRGYVPLLPLDYASLSSNSEYRLFAHDEWRISPKLIANFGGMLEKDGWGNQRTSPRIALNFHLTPQQTLRIGASVAYRSPSLVEVKFPTRPQPGSLFIPDTTITSANLLPEKLFSQEIGYLSEFPDWATSLDLRLFSDQLSNGIFLASTGKFVNGMSASSQGVEATLKHSFTEKSEININFSHALANSNGPELAASGQKTFQPASPWINDVLSGSIPRNNASVLYSQHLPDNWSFSAAYYYQDAMQPFDRGAVDYQPIQRRADIRLAKSFKWSQQYSGETSLVIQNLFNKGYTEYISNNLFNRTSYVTFTLNW